jgi:tetratricopeptide (TPR) repeat protein
MATELNQNYSRPHQVRAEMLSMQGRDEAALREIQRALEIDPLSLANNAICSFCFYYARRYDECIQEAGKTLELDANFFYGLWALGVACAHKRDFPKAIAELDRTVELTNENSMLLGILGAIQFMHKLGIGIVRSNTLKKDSRRNRRDFCG